MSRLEQLLMRAAEMRAHELWMAPGQPARARVGREWKDVSAESWAAHETKALLSSPLSEFDKREFFETGFWKGQLQLIGRPLSAQFQMTEQGIAGSFKWRGPEALDWDAWGLPAHLLEIVTRTRGMTMVTGPSGSGKSSLLFLLAQKLGPSSALVHYYSEQGSRDGHARISTLPLKALASAKHSAADIVVVDDAGPEHWSHLQDLSESGRHVVFSMTALNLFSGFERWRRFHQESGRPSLEGLQMAVGPRLVAGLEVPLVPVAELLLVTQKLRAPLRDGRWDVLEEEMKTTGEKTGMRTMNQALLQLLLRRRIEMRTAFGESQNPDEFDHLLKKVGI